MPRPPRPRPHPAPPTRQRPRRSAGARWTRWTLTAAATAALAACGGGGGNSEPAGPTNQAPTASISMPAANAVFGAGAAIRIAATASDSDGTIARVEFYDGTTKLGEATAAPYEFLWTSAATGAHSLSVHAIDNAGAVGSSGTVALTVSAAPAPNQAPTVSITSPANGFKPNDPATFTLAATASDPDGTVAAVEFFLVDPAAPVYDASTRLGPGTPVGAPPSYQLSTTRSAGTYTFVARATDDQGATTNSASLQVIVNALPAVSITSPAAGATLQAGSNVTLHASASDADGSIAKVEFFLDGSATPLGQATRVGTTTDYTLAWNSVPVGSHTLVARATDNDGATRSTASLATNVSANVAPTVTLDAPTAGTNAPTTLRLSASAGDSDGTVASVQFFNGATLLGAGTLGSGKYTLQVPIAANQPGTYTITARATDNQGAQTTTASQSVTIAANVPPVVNVTSAANATLPVNATTGPLTLAASASDSDGIAKVEFFNGATKLGEATTAPYQVTWTGVGAGSYSITAKATDSVGSVTTSAVQSLVVTANIEGSWSNLSTAQRAGIPLAPDRPIADGGVDADEVFTAIGVNTVAPKYVYAMAQAVRLLADLPLTVTGDAYVACPQGGTTNVKSKSATENFVNYLDCKIGGFTLYGGAAVPPYPQTYNPAAGGQQTVYISSIATYTQVAANRFRILVEGVKVSGNGSPQAANEQYPHNAYGWSFVECTVTGNTRSCLTNHENSFLWGWDLSWANWTDNAMTFQNAEWNLYQTDDNYLLNGTMRPCQGDPQPQNYYPAYCVTTPPAAHHIKFDNMTNSSGRAIVYGNNGWSVVTRLPREQFGVERVTVRRFLTQAVNINGINYAAGAGPLETYRCPVDANGFTVCAFVSAAP
ncbi:MAG: Ig-like domain-containing protein [Rubrivivax sp.]